jgi:hypothetical protein
MARVEVAADGSERLKDLATHADLIDIVKALKAGSIHISDVPIELHPKLTSLLSIAKNEARFSNQQELYDHLSDIIWSLQLAHQMPEKEIYRAPWTVAEGDGISLATRTLSKSPTKLTQTTYTHPIPLITAFRGTTNTIGALRQLGSEFRGAESFWRDEIERLHTLRDADLKRLQVMHSRLVIPDDPVEADVVRTEILFETDRLDKHWVRREEQLRADMEYDLSAIRTKISQLRGTRTFNVRAPKVAKTARFSRTRKLLFGPAESTV